MEPEGGIELGLNAMKPLANRKVVIGCVQAYKMLLRLIKRCSGWYAGILSAILTLKAIDLYSCGECVER